MKKRKEKIKLSQKQKEQLEQMLVKGRWSPRELKRAEILLMANSQKKLNKRAISRELQCGHEKVIRVIQRFQKHRDLDKALFDLPRPGQPKSLTPKEEAFVIATACSDAPEGNSVWTLELLRKNFQEHKGKSVSKSKIGTILLKHELKPWKKKDVVRSKINRKVHSKNG